MEVDKTTAIKTFESKLIENKINYYLPREPGGSKIAEGISNIILVKNNTEEAPKTEDLLYGTRYLVDIDIPKLNDGVIVIKDRYIDSSLTYQGYARD